MNLSSFEPLRPWSDLSDTRDVLVRRHSAALAAGRTPWELLLSWAPEGWRLPRGGALHNAAISAISELSHDLPGKLADLDLIGGRIAMVERRGWELPPGPNDRELIAAWDAWFEGRPWDHRTLWERRYLHLAREAVRAVARHLRLPEAALRRVLDDLEDSFFLVLFGDEDGVPTWLDIGLLALERAPEGPVMSLGSCLNAPGWDRLGACLRRRGAWPATLNCAPGVAAPRDAAALEELLDLHVLRQVLTGADTASALDLDRAWRVVRSNRGRMRGRLRALLVEGPRDGIRGRLLRHPALSRATETALARFWFHQAWQELRRDFTFDGRDLATPPCAPTEEDATTERLELNQGALRTWVLLVALRGRWEHLQRWAEEGSTGDRDSTWGRLLADQLPAALARGAAGQRDLRPLRDYLSMNLADVLTSLLPTLEAVASAQPGPGLNDVVRRVLKPGWHAEVDFPQRRFAELRDHAAALLQGRPMTEEEPWIQPEISS